MMRAKTLLRAALLLAATAASSNALAFCRTTTCDPNDPKQHCEIDAQNCVTSGLPLAWPSSCVTIGVQKMGSPANGFTYDDVASVVEQAFGTWMKASCGGSHPSIDVKLIGPIECGVSEYNSKAGNANIVLFREDDWPYVGASNAIGLTTTRFDTKTGDLWDADIELNGVGANLSIGDPIKGDDLLSVLTHEGGHFLGLAHSSDPTATMKPVYNPATDGDMFRSLARDDIEGICAIYPPDRKPATTSCDNRHGFSSECGADQPPQDTTSKGCSLNGRTGVLPLQSSRDLAALGFLGAILTRRLARRRRFV
jgi:hypothetical protein